jgi:hypothetical protein
VDDYMDRTHITRAGEDKCMKGCGGVNQKESDHMEDLGTHGRILNKT